MSNSDPVRYKDGLTIAQLKELLKDAPEVDANGNPFILMLNTGGVDEYTLPVQGVLVEQTMRKLADGTYGNQITVFKGY